MFAYYEWLLLAFPIVGACTNLLGGTRLSHRSQDTIAMIGVSGPLLIILPLLVGIAIDPDLVGRPIGFSWIQVWSGSRFVEARFALRLDMLSTLLTAAMLFGAWFVHLCAIRDLPSSASRPFVLAQLNGTLSAAMVALLADNVLFLLLGWSLSSWLAYGLLRVARDDPTAANGEARVPVLASWVSSDVALLIATAIVSRRFASLSLDDLIALSPAPGLQEVPVLSLTVAGALVCAAALLRMGVFPWNLPLPAMSAGWSRAMARGLVLFLPGVYLLARLSPLLTAVPAVSTAIAWWGVLAALVVGVSAVARRSSWLEAHSLLFGQAPLLLVAIAAGSLPAALAFLPVSALSQTLILLASAPGPYSRIPGKPRAAPAWVMALGIASLVGLPPLGAFPFCTYLLAALWRTNITLWSLTLVALFLLAAGGARATRSLYDEESAEARGGALSVLAAAVVALGVAGLGLSGLVRGLPASTLASMPDQPGWWWFAAVAVVAGTGAWIGYGHRTLLARFQRPIATGTATEGSVEQVWERATVRPVLALSSFLAQTVEPGWAEWTFGLLNRWVAGPRQPHRGRLGLPALVALFMLAAAAILAFLLFVR